MSKSIAVIAAHPDDEVLGCGGTIARMAVQGCPVHILLVADGETSRSNEGNIVDLEHRRCAAQKAGEILGCSSVELLTLPDNRLDRLERLDIIKMVENFLDRYHPSIVFTHHVGDVNIDHQILHHAVVTACRPMPGKSIEELLFFEVPSSTEWRPYGSAESFNPNWFTDISQTLEIKLRALRAYEAELREFPHPRSLRAVSALAEWRGATAGFMAAEAFVLGRKLL